MPRERSLDRDRRSLGVADLTDHHDVGIGAQDGTKRVREREFGAAVDLQLVHVRQQVLDRILDRDDVDVRADEIDERRVERRGLARSGRPGDDECAAHATGEAFEVHLHGVRHADGRERRSTASPLQQAQHRTLAADRGQDRDTNVHVLVPRRHRCEPAVLARPVLGDVEARDHLEPGDDGGPDIG